MCFPVSFSGLTVLTPGRVGGQGCTNLGRGDLAGADGPDGLVGDDDLGPVLDDVGDGLELAGDDGDGGAVLALLEALAAAQDHAEAGGERGGRLGRDKLVALAEDGAALRVAEQDPLEPGVDELRRRDLAGVGAVALVVQVLGRDLDLGAQRRLREQQVQRRRRDNDLCGGSAAAGTVGGRGVARTNVLLEGGGVQVGDDLLDGGDGAVGLEVASDEECASLGFPV